MSESQRTQTTAKNESIEPLRTVLFIGAAALSILAAFVTRPSAPKVGAEFADVGEMFYPDFMEADKAKSLEVVSYNKDIGSIRRFAVAQDKDGRWRIPSALNYPADGKDQLAKTATSVIGIKREAFAGRRESEHADFGVLDPNTESTTDFNGVGNRITLKDGDGKVLADYIIGKEVKGQSGYHYIRRPDQKVTYRAKINIQVSTKFIDWIESDLLKIDAARLSTVKIDTTSIVEGEQRQVVDGEQSLLSRKTSSDPWKIEGLDEAKEEVNQDEVKKISDALDNLKIVGVRKKPQQLIQSLKEGSFQLNQLTMLDLDSKGFMLARSRNGQGYQMIAKNGNLVASTDQGVRYDLKFGEIFSGTDEEVEVGFGTNDDGTEKTKPDEKKAEGEKKEGDKATKKSRYLLVTVSFDAASLGPKPVAPEKPEQPEEAKSDDKPADDEAAKAKEEAKKAYEAAKAKFDSEQAKYEADLKSYKDKMKDGEKLVKSLNQRFADWYYVVSGDSFDNLRQGRKTLVKEKAVETKAEGAAGDGSTAPKDDAAKEDAPKSDAAKTESDKGDAPKESPKEDKPESKDEPKSETKSDPEPKSEEGKTEPPKSE